MTLEALQAALDIGEGQEIEFKAAEQGLPKSIWPTVSAFANSDGGYIILGVREKTGNYFPEGVKNPAALRQTFWDTHNNVLKLNHPVCAPDDVFVQKIDSTSLICIRIPRADRRLRPVFIDGNPYRGTYKRNNQGDYRCSENEVRQMLRDAGDEPQDGQILEGYGLDDLDRDTLNAYRARFSSREPGHPYLAFGDIDFLERIGAWRQDRSRNIQGITAAGLLMFGSEQAIFAAFPYFYLDYREQLSTDPDIRWTYRLSPDGKWVPNLFNFFFKAYLRLTQDLDVPFQVDSSATRKDETHAHEALREALVNTLIHADYQTSKSIVVLRQKDSFVFSNPGQLRITLDQLYRGGVSDPRNPNLQKMFQFLGLGEKAGSGFQKILRAWKEQQWLIPHVVEKRETGITEISLPLASMVPEEVEKELRAVVGAGYEGLSELDRVILMLAHKNEEIGNQDIQRYRNEHPRDLSASLAKLVEAGWLQKKGQTRGTRYSWSSHPEDDLFSVSGTANNPGFSKPLPLSQETTQETTPTTQETTPTTQETTPTTQETAQSLTTREQIIQLLEQDPTMTRRDLATSLGLTDDGIKYHLDKMRESGLLKHEGPTKSGYWRILKKEPR